MQACQHAEDTCICHISRQSEVAEASKTPCCAMCDENVAAEEEVNIEQHMKPVTEVCLAWVVNSTLSSGH